MGNVHRVVGASAVMMALVMITLSAGGCASSSSSNASSCSSAIEGTYTVTGTKESGNCDQVYPEGVGQQVTIQFVRDNSGQLLLIQQGVPGGGCPVEAKACKVTGSCVINFASTPMQGTLQVSYTFDAKGYTGISSYAFPPLKDVNGKMRAACSETDDETGVRR